MKKYSLLFCFLISCGQGSSPSEGPADPVPANPGNEGGLTFAGDVQPLLKSYCEECHSGATFIASEAQFLRSSAPTRIANKSMPQRGSKNFSKWGDSQRSIIANFVNEKK